jgi:hypothetical protein
VHEEHFPWHDQLRADLRTHKGIGRFKDPSAITQAYFELEGKLGSAIIPPGENATEEEKQAYRSKIGRVKNSEEYGISFDNGISKDDQALILKTCIDLDLDKDQAVRFAQKLQEERLTFTEKMKGQQKIMEEQRAQAQEKKRLAGQSALKEQWGDAYDRNMRLASRAIEAYPKAEALKKVIKAHQDILLEPVFVEYLSGIGRKTLEHEMVTGSQGGDGGEYHFKY